MRLMTAMWALDHSMSWRVYIHRQRAGDVSPQYSRPIPALRSREHTGRFRFQAPAKLYARVISEDTPEEHSNKSDDAEVYIARRSHELDE